MPQQRQLSALIVLRPNLLSHLHDERVRRAFRPHTPPEWAKGVCAVTSSISSAQLAPTPARNVVMFYSFRCVHQKNVLIYPSLHFRETSPHLPQHCHSWICLHQPLKCLLFLNFGLGSGSQRSACGCGTKSGVRRLLSSAHSAHKEQTKCVVAEVYRILVARALIARILCHTREEDGILIT